MTRPRMLAAIVAAATIASSEAPAFVRSAMGEARPSGTAVIVALPQEAAWQDFAFLAAVAASHKANDGVPLVIASAADGALRPEAQDFLARRTPESVVVLAETDADSTACALSKRFFTRSQSVVVCSSNDYSGALVATVLAARERAPLLYTSAATLAEPVRAELVRLGTTKVLYVGASAADYADLNGVTAERLPTALDVARWMQAHGRTIDYLAVAAPADRTNGHRRKVSGLKASAPLPSPLAWDGRWFLDEHADGSRSVYFRVQLIDFDMSTGKVGEKAERLRFRME